MAFAFAFAVAAARTSSWMSWGTCTAWSSFAAFGYSKLSLRSVKMMSGCAVVKREEKSWDTGNEGRRHSDDINGF